MLKLNDKITGVSSISNGRPQMIKSYVSYNYRIQSILISYARRALYDRIYENMEPLKLNYWEMFFI